MAEVVLKDIDKVYPGNVKVVFKNNIEVKDKEFVVFVGPSGCGKSTTLRMIAGLEDITAGDLFIDGKRMNDVEPKDRDIAMVFQNYALYPHMTVFDNMAFGLKIRKFPKEDIKARVDEAAGILHIENLLDRKPKALSGGQRQRVAIARSLMMNPDVLLLDEPTSSLDPVSSSEVMDVIRELKKKKMTIVMVTHRLDLAAEVSDRIAFMYNGQIYETGTADQIIYRPQNRVTRNYIDHCLNLVYEIHSSKYDYPELNARIENFCNRYKLGPQSVHSVQLVVEEFLVQQLFRHHVDQTAHLIAQGLIIPYAHQVCIRLDQMQVRVERLAAKFRIRDVEAYIDAVPRSVIGLKIAAVGLVFGIGLQQIVDILGKS